MPFHHLVGIALNLQIALGSIIILTILILPVQEHGVSFYLFVSSLISFISILQFAEYRSFTSLLFIVQLPSHIWLFETLWTEACQTSLSLTISWSLPKFIFIASEMPSSCLILWCPLLLLPSIFPSIRDFSNESSVCIRWPEYWSSSMSLVKLQDTKLIHRNLLYFYTLAMKDQKEKVNKKCHLLLHQKRIKHLGINLRGQNICSPKLVRCWEKKLKMTQRDGKIYTMFLNWKN